MEAFPGGIRDASGDSFYVRIAGGDLVAVALADGSVRWRRAAAPRPVAASPAYLLGVDDSSPRLTFVLLAAADGAEIARVEAGGRVPMGDLVETSLDEGPDGPRIAWRTEPRYGGGASPGILAMAGREERAGRIAIDPRTGAVRHLEPAETRSGDANSILAGFAAGAAAGAPAAGPALALKRGEGGEVVLEARDRDGALRWTAPLGTAPRSRPAPLRP